MVVVFQSFSHVQFFVTPWTATCQASLFFILSQNLLKPMSTELVMPSNHLILCRPLLLLSSIFPSIKVFSSEPAVCVRWPKYWSFSFSWIGISAKMNIQGWFPLCLDLLGVYSQCWNLSTFKFCFFIQIQSSSSFIKLNNFVDQRNIVRKMHFLVTMML